MKKRERNKGIISESEGIRGNVTVSTQTSTSNPVNPVILFSTIYVYDQFGHSIEAIDALGQSTFFVYDLRDSVIKQYGATYPVWYAYDIQGRMIAMATTRDTTLDPGTVDSLDNPSLDVTQWTYDPATGLLVQKLYDDGKGPSYTYTPDGKLATRTWARGVGTEYGYSSSGELASIQYSDGTRPVQKTYNRLGSPVSVISAGTTNAFEYSPTTLEKISDKQLGYEVCYGHDDLGRMEMLSITNLYDGSYAYDSFGRFAKASFEGMDFNYGYLPGSDQVAGIAYGAVEKTVAYETLRDLGTGVSYHNTNGLLIAERKYAYNGVGNVLSRTRQRGVNPVETDDFDHNIRSELIAASLGGTNSVSGDYGYTYDPIGNRTVATNLSEVITYAANELNQYTNILSDAEFIPAFDDDGNQTKVKTSTGIWHITYNAENRPVVWTSTTGIVVEMAYDHMGRRIHKKVSDNNGVQSDLQFIYDGYLQVVSMATNAVTTTFWDPTESIATRPLAMNNGGVYTYTHDLTKNVMELLDDSGAPVVTYDYDAFGSMTASAPFANCFGFSSEYYDRELGSVYYNYRHYNPLNGRWLNRDPMGEESFFVFAEIDLELNITEMFYGYVYNSPASRTDYVGLRGAGSRERRRVQRCLTRMPGRCSGLQGDLLTLCLGIAADYFFSEFQARGQGMAACEDQQSQRKKTDSSYPVITNPSPCYCCVIGIRRKDIDGCVFYKLAYAAVEPRSCEDSRNMGSIHNPNTIEERYSW